CSDDILDEATRHHLFTDTFCRVCWAVLPFESQRMSHYESLGKHKIRLEKTSHLFGFVGYLCIVWHVGTGIIPVSFQGRKHAQNVYLYVQSHGMKDERMKHDKKKEIMDCTNFQVTILHG
ncbi:hypothetical protein CIB84_014050, partial [Bambusicola thoracicus]